VLVQFCYQSAPRSRVLFTCRWRRHVAAKCRVSEGLHGATAQKAAHFQFSLIFKGDTSVEIVVTEEISDEYEIRICMRILYVCQNVRRDPLFFMKIWHQIVCIQYLQACDDITATILDITQRPVLYMHLRSFSKTECSLRKYKTGHS
jgi:hypothetical protein